MLFIIFFKADSQRRVLEGFLWQSAIVGGDHGELGRRRLGLPALLAGRAALREDRDQEVHEVDVSAERPHHIGHPSRELVLPLLKF